MTFEQFDQLTDSLLAEVKNMRDTKGKEYAGTKDRFDNFNRLAVKTNLDRKQIWLVLFTKHIDAIESYIANGRTFSSESIRGRIIDAITYLLLLEGMIEETLDTDHVVNTQENSITTKLNPVDTPVLPKTCNWTSNFETCVLPLEHKEDHDFHKVWMVTHKFKQHGIHKYICSECGNFKKDHAIK